MHLCRTAWNKLAPLATSRGTAALLRNAPVRQMTSKSVPGSSGEALPYYLFLGCAFTGGGVYVYRTLSRDKDRFQDRHSYLESRPKEEFTPKPWPPQGEEEEISSVSEVTEEATEAVAVEAVSAEEVKEQVTFPAAALEQVETLTEGMETPVTTEAAVESEAAPVQENEVAESISVSEANGAVTVEAVAGSAEEVKEQETVPAAPLDQEEALTEENETPVHTEEAVESEAAPLPGEEAVSNSVSEAFGPVAAEKVKMQETVPAAPLEQGEALTEEKTPIPTESAVQSEATPLPAEQVSGSSEEASETASVPVVEEISDNIEVELASAAEDWSELSARKPEEVREEVSQVGAEVVESEEVSASS
ncbi:protein MGARP [Rhinophrynus dorsalis]